MPITQILNFDQELMKLINTGMSNPFFDQLMIFITHLGSPYFWLLVGLTLLIKKKVSAIGIAIGLAVNAVASLGIKALFMRSRPGDVLEGIKTLVVETDSSFPSAHTSTAFLGAVVLSYYYPKGKPFFYGLAALIAVSRIYVGVHFPLDVIVGAVLGLLVGKWVLTLPLTKYSKKYGFTRK